nr:U-box domain-containing protein 40 [Ipomoea batatas]
MADLVIVSSGHTFERHCVNACKSLCFTPVLHDGSAPDFSAVIPNLALRSAILNWCESSLLESPAPIDFLSAEKLVRALMDSQSRGTEKHSDCEGSCTGFLCRYPEFGAQSREMEKHSDCEVLKEFSESWTTSSDEESAVAPASGPTTPLTRRPACYSSSSSSCDLEALHSILWTR